MAISNVLDSLPSATFREVAVDRTACNTEYAEELLLSFGDKIHNQGKINDKGRKSLRVARLELDNLAERLTTLGFQQVASEINNYGRQSSFNTNSAVWVSTQVVRFWIHKLTERNLSDNQFGTFRLEIAPLAKLRVEQEAQHTRRCDRRGIPVYGHPRDHFRPYNSEKECLEGG
jgi:hypothetical protein